MRVHLQAAKSPSLATGQTSPCAATDHVRVSFLPKAEPKRHRMEDKGYPESEEGRVETQEDESEGHPRNPSKTMAVGAAS